MIKVIINNKEIQAEEGSTILQVAQKNGIEIPTLCHHPALETQGSCRVCTVEASKGKWKKFVTACNYPVWDGLEVNTNSELVLSTRKIIVELLLARCPDVKVVQDLAKDLGIKKIRFNQEENNCILCGLCVRVCEERMGRSAISLVDRGINIKVDTPFHRKTDVCMACGSCVSVCPTGVLKLEDITTHKPVPLLSEFDEGLRTRSPIYLPYPQAIPNVPAIDKNSCVNLNTGKCKICQDVCESKAIDFEQEDEIVDIEVGSIILSSGFDEFNASAIANYGYDDFKNVITSIEFERILSASGPYQGHLVRPSDQTPPKKIAWIQCVGSRNVHTSKNNYCSSVCCTYAIKEAVVAKEHSSVDLDTSIFYIDIRTHGKGFEKYYERAKNEQKVRFVKSQVHRIYCDENDNLTLRYIENNKIKEEEFDLVVLSVGIKPKVANQELSKKLGLDLNEHGFCQVSNFAPVNTSKDGIFTAGAFSGPKDIPETVMEASAAASEASCIISSARHTLTSKKEYPQERNIVGEKQRIGVFVCHCGVNIGSVVNVNEVKSYAGTLPNVVYTDNYLFTCSQDSQQNIKEKIEQYRLNRVVVAACTPRTHEPLFQETLKSAGLNKYLFEMANIRDQCSWVHMNEPEKATEKAKDLIRMSVAKAKLIEPLFQTNLEVNHSALVVGGGISGMVSALNIAKQGFGVHVVEKSSQLGGIANNIHSTIEGFDVQAYLKELIDEVSNNPLIHLYTEAEIQDVSGYVGNFKTRLVIGAGKEEKEITHGVVIIASGGDIYKPNEYLYGENPNVFSLIELEGKIAKKNPLISTGKNIVLIQCVGSRDDERPYCSRTCCSKAVKLALKLKEINPDVNIYVLYRDIRTYGFKEQYYLEAREKGVMFLPYDVSDKPKVEAINKEGKDFIKVTTNDLILNESFSIDADILALATAIIPSPDSKKIAGFFKVPLNEDGFFMEAHIKLRPVDFPTEGVFVCGLAHSPKLIEESITQAKAAASRATIILSKDKIESGGTISTIDKDKCSGCGMCVELCPFNAIEIDDKDNTATINEALCKGCGVCASSCRCGAVDIMGFTDNAIYSMIKNGVLE